jgi:hypothetical protein
MKIARCSQQVLADADTIRTLEAGVSFDHSAAGHIAQTLLDTGA